MPTRLAEKLLFRLFRHEPSPVRPGPKTPYIFLHINKTAGTSVGRAIGLPVKRHLTAREIIDRIGRQRWAAASLPRLNASGRRNYRDYCDARSHDIFAHWFAEDIDRFAYRFENPNFPEP